MWDYPFVVKTGLFSIFHHFQAFIEHNFLWKNKFVQTHWGGEYRKLNTFFQSIDIHHHLICPHTYDQNGTNECHHQYIGETSLTILSVKPHYDFEIIRLNPRCILSIVFLLLSYTIRTCLSVFFIVLLIMTFYVHLSIFAFPCLHPYHACKLDFHSSSCMFLGYNFSHLSYRCLDLTSQHIYIFCHGCFHENVFSFEKSE